MKLGNRVFVSVLLNIILAVVFVFANIWALDSGLEETFVVIALFYGLFTVVSNAVYITKIK